LFGEQSWATKVIFGSLFHSRFTPPNLFFSSFFPSFFSLGLKKKKIVFCFVLF